MAGTGRCPSGDRGGHRRADDNLGSREERLLPRLLPGWEPGEIVQWILFLAVSLVLLIFTRPVAVKYMNRKVSHTNADSLIGKKAVVIQEINNLAQTGQVKINDLEWMARTENDDSVIPEKTIVVIREIEGVKLIVEEEKEG